MNKIYFQELEMNFVVQTFSKYSNVSARYEPNELDKLTVRGDLSVQKQCNFDQ